MDADILTRLNALRRERRAAVLVTKLDDASARLVTEGDEVGGPLGEAVEKAFLTGKSGAVSLDGEEHFINVHLPPARIVVIGAVHISQALAPMARLAGFDVTIIDPRTAFATDDRFPDIELLAEWPQDVLGDRPLDSYTALVAVTHDPKIDDMPLKAALDAGCFYVGALGSRKTHAKRNERLLEGGLTEAQLARIEAPIGLDIRASSPAEIAVAILGSIIRALRGRKLASTREMAA